MFLSLFLCRLIAFPLFPFHACSPNDFSEGCSAYRIHISHHALYLTTYTQCCGSETIYSGSDLGNVPDPILAKFRIRPRKSSGFKSGPYKAKFFNQKCFTNYYILSGLSMF